MIETERLLIKNAEMKDQKRICEILTNLYKENENLCLLTEPFSFDYEEEKRTRQSRIDKSRKDNYYIWTIIEKKSKEIIGEISLLKFNDPIINNKDIVELQIFIDNDYHNKDYAFETLIYILDYVFNNTSIKEIKAFISENNIKFFYTLSYLGFKGHYNYHRIKTYTFHEKAVPANMLGIKKEEYFSYINRIHKRKILI